MRPGRFDRVVYVGPPDQAGREEILKIRIRSMAVDPDIDIPEIARLVSWLASWCLTPLIRTAQSDGCSGAEITALCQEAAMLTMQQDMDAPFVSQIVIACHVWRLIVPRSLKRHLFQ
jgi:AAA family ATPase